MCRLAGLLLLPLVAASCAWAAAEGEEENNAPQEDIRFDLFKADGEVYRFDRKTGEILKIVKTREGFMAVPQPIKIVTRLAGKTKDGPLPAKIGPHPAEAEMAQFDETQKKGPKAPIEIFNEQGEDITFQLTDPERDASKPAIMAYQNSLSLLHTLEFRERISGNVLVRNLGDKKLKALELTLQIPVVGREKPEEHRFLFVDKPGQAGPPQPASAGREANHLLQKVDLPCPAGGVKGSPVLKVTYLKFAD
jgi:hypothetical protein